MKQPTETGQLDALQLLDLAPTLVDSHDFTFGITEVADDAVSYSIRFDRPFDGTQTARALAGPLPELRKGTYCSDVARGLRQVTYPNSRVTASLQAAGQGDFAQSLHPEIRKLDNVMGNYRPVNERWIRGRLHEPIGAALFSMVSLRRSKPTEFKDICQQIGITFDELAAVRQARSKQRPVTIDDYLSKLSETELDTLSNVVRDREFMPVIARVDGEYQTLYIQRSDVPADVADKNVISTGLVGPIPAHAIGRYRPLRITYAQAGQEAIPVLRWTKTSDGQRHFDLATSGFRFNRHTLHMQYDSPLLGAMLLAAYQGNHARHEAEVRQVFAGDRAPHDQLPRYFAGLGATVLNRLETELLATPYVVQAETIINSRQQSS